MLSWLLQRWSRPDRRNNPASSNRRVRPLMELLENRLAPASSFLSLPEFAGATVQSLFVPGTGAGAGKLYVAKQANGDVSVAYEQDLGVNDNTYGVNAIGWGTKGHTLRDLLGSDKAEFRFWDANGKLVMDFYQDYVSQGGATPSGYTSFGARAEEGKMLLGDVGWLTDWDTGQARNLNTFKQLYGSTTVAGVNLLLDSPPADANFNPTNPSVFSAWDYHDWFRVRISAAAFGSAGFGKVSVVDQHNSPSKNGVNSFTPEPPPETPPELPPSGTTCVVMGTITFKDKNMIVPLTNSSGKPMPLEGIELTWPESSGKLKRIKLNGTTIFDNDVKPDSVSITLFKDKLDKRTLAAGASVELVIEFEKKADQNKQDFKVHAHFPCCPDLLPPPSSVSGYVFQDVNENGERDAGDLGLKDVIVLFQGFDFRGQAVSMQTRTDASGYYVFENLVPGSYALKEQQPLNYIDGKDSLGTQGGLAANDLFTFDLLSGLKGERNNFGELLNYDPPT